MLDRLALSARMLGALPLLMKHKPGGHLTVADRVEARARERPGHPFILFEDRRLSYRELNAAANRVAHWALEMGLRQGDVVALLMENRPEYVCTWAGFAKLGVTVALINTNLAGRALGHAVTTAEPKLLILGSECSDRFATVAAELPGTLPIWVDRDPDAPAAAGLPDGANDLGTRLAEQRETNPDPTLRAGLHSGDNLFYIYTSGTTGLPKAARFSHLRFNGTGDLAAFGLRLRPDDVHYCALPLYHTAGGAMVVSSVLSTGATMALRRRFSASRFWEDIRRYDATCFQYIGEFCRYLMNQPERSDDRKHHVRAAIGNGLRTDIWKAFQERFGIRQVVEFYGATEGNTLTINLENKVGSVGRFPFKFLTNARLVRFDLESEAHVRDERGLCVECRPGEVGEFLGQISSAPASRFEGYTSKEATDRKILRDVFKKGDAWFRSGDLLRQDADGFFYFVDRIGDTFRWKGENVSTQEVANLLSGFPGLSMVNVYGVRIEGADGRAGMAAAVTDPEHAFDAKAFYRFVKQALPSYAAPVFLRLVGQADVTGTFKLRKVTLQEEGFDPERIADPLFVRDDAAEAYVPLSVESAAEIRSGRRRL